MRGFRFSLASLVGVVCVAAVVLGAWRFDPTLCASLVGTLTMFSIASATVAGLLGNEATRRRWLPFAVFAWSYSGAIWIWWFESRPVHYLVSLFRETSGVNWSADPIYSVAESIFTFLIGFIGMLACHFYWKHHPPGGSRDESKPG